MKDLTVFICQGCGARFPKWMGRCAQCGEWNTLIEEIEEAEAASSETSTPATRKTFFTG